MGVYGVAHGAHTQTLFLGLSPTTGRSMPWAPAVTGAGGYRATAAACAAALAAASWAPVAAAAAAFESAPRCCFDTTENDEALVPSLLPSIKNWCKWKIVVLREKFPDDFGNGVVSCCVGWAGRGRGGNSVRKWSHRCGPAEWQCAARAPKKRVDRAEG